MNQVFVVQIKDGNNAEEFLAKRNKGYLTSKNIGLHNLYHSKDVADREAKQYIRDVEIDLEYFERKVQEMAALEKAAVARISSGETHCPDTLKYLPNTPYSPETRLLASLEFYKKMSMRGKSYVIITYDLVMATQNTDL
jgi:hypothetical protein